MRLAALNRTTAKQLHDSIVRHIEPGVSAYYRSLQMGHLYRLSFLHISHNCGSTVAMLLLFMVQANMMTSFWFPGMQGMQGDEFRNEVCSKQNGDLEKELVSTINIVFTSFHCISSEYALRYIFERSCAMVCLVCS